MARSTWGRGSRGGFVPRAGIAEPKIRQAPKALVPLKPNVQQPAKWSQPVEEIVEEVGRSALQNMVESKYGEELRGRGLELALVEMDDEVERSAELKRELYEIAIHLVGSVSPPSGFSSKGPPVDRAEARLYLWLKIFGKAGSS